MSIEIKNDSYIIFLPNSSHGHEGPPKALPCSLEERTRKFFWIPVRILKIQTKQKRTLTWRINKTIALQYKEKVCVDKLMNKCNDYNYENVISFVWLNIWTKKPFCDIFNCNYATVPWIFPTLDFGHEVHKQKSY